MKVDWKKIIAIVLQILISLPLDSATDEQIQEAAMRAVSDVKVQTDTALAEQGLAIADVDWAAVVEEVVGIFKSVQRLIALFKAPEASI